MRLLACLIVAPQRGYDEPAIPSYAISSFCPTSADGLHITEGRVLIKRAGFVLSFTGFDPACVKTHTIAKCRKYNSPTRYRTSCAEHDSTPWCAISLRCFYVRGGRWSFRTANGCCAVRAPRAATRQH